MYRTLQSVFLITFVAILGVLAALNMVKLAEHSFFPVLIEFEAHVIDKGVDAVIVAGSVRKARNCEYMPPWTARTLSGRSLRVEQSSQDAPNWALGNVQFAPILVYGAGNESFEMFAQHQCNFLWPMITYLGVVENGGA